MLLSCAARVGSFPRNALFIVGKSTLMHPLVTIALRAARDAGEALAHSVDRLDRVDILRDDGDDFLTSMDEQADRTLIYHLSKAYPDYSIQSRVSGLTEGAKPNHRWLIDPVSGNRNFASGNSQFAVSVACEIDGKITHAVLFNPMLQEEFTASRGGGAQLNARRIRTGKRSELKNALIGLNPQRLDAERFLSLQRDLMSLGASPRLSGCSALDMAYVACGRLSAGWCASGADAVDLACAALILQEAGGFVGDDRGGPDTRNARELVFGNPKLFRELVKIRARRS